MNTFRNILVLTIAVTLSSCSFFGYDEMLEEALVLAGDNCEELEKVLTHYEKDIQKLEAAKFLIRNMPGHYSYADTSVITRYSSAVDRIMKDAKGLGKQGICDSINAVAVEMGIPNLKKRYDIELITADYLIRNIDDAFESWKNKPWAQHLNFDEFCEYLLPYKITELQLLDDWRIRLKKFHTDRLKELDYCDALNNTTFQACKLVNAALMDSLQPDHTFSVTYPVMKIESSASIPFGTCDNYSVIAAAVMISSGIPIIRESTPQWAYRNMGHAWNVVLGSNGKEIPFGGVCSTPGEAYMINEKMAKAYRHTYAINKDMQILCHEEKHLPNAFKTSFLQDVTKEYVSCKDVEVNAKDCTRKYIYLAVFDDRNWSPVAYAKVINGTAVFKDMGINCMYQALGYNDDGTILYIDEPFVLKTKGEKEYVQTKADVTSMTLKRKYPVLEYVYNYLPRLEGGEFHASNDKEFNDYHIIHKITDCHATGFDIEVPDSLCEYRYWRYYSTRKGSWCNMAEIRFFCEESDQPLSGTIIGTDGSLFNLPDRTKEKVFDNDILTIHEAATPDSSWVGLDFGKKVKLNRIQYYGRGDGNCIEPGDEYELLYWKGGQWHSLGQQTAKRTTLVFENIPTNGLYILKDLTKGKDERIFTYKDGKQIWW